MITDLWIENFKGIGKRQHIPLRPVTLLFGANSAGKSTVMHALAYLREVLCHREFDPRSNVAGTTSISLDGFDGLLHRNGTDKATSISLGLRLEVGDHELESLYPRRYRYTDSEYSSGMPLAFELNDWLPSAISLVCEIELGNNHPGCRKVEIELNDEEFCLLSLNAEGQVWCDLNCNHAWLRDVLSLTDIIAEEPQPDFGAVRFRLNGETSALPAFKDRIDISGWNVTQWLNELFERHFPQVDLEDRFNVDEFYYEEDVIAADLRTLVSQQIHGACKLAATRLDQLIHIGPKRATVPRTLSSKNPVLHANWGDGLAAWNQLLNASDNLVERVSEWLNAGRLNTGYQLVREKKRLLDTAVWQKLLDGRTDEWSTEALRNAQEVRTVFLKECLSEIMLHPQDVGEGISQILPIITALLQHVDSADKQKHVFEEDCETAVTWQLTNEHGNMLSIEQPELHLHPAVAARVGDLLLHGAKNSRNLTILAETHSEHIILRLLRRIRQTTDDELPDHIPPVKPDDVCVLYVDNLGDGTVIKRLRISDRGNFLDPWPHGFFRERAEELF